MKKIEYENGAFAVEAARRVRINEGGVYIYWNCENGAVEGIVIKDEEDLFYENAIYKLLTIDIECPKKLRKFEPGLYRVKGGLVVKSGEWAYRIKSENGVSLFLSGDPAASDFDTAYSEYEKAEFKPVGEE
jgi:hypothetical protein